MYLLKVKNHYILCVTAANQLPLELGHSQMSHDLLIQSLDLKPKNPVHCFCFPYVVIERCFCIDYIYFNLINYCEFSTADLQA